MADLLLENSTSEVQATCIDLLERMGAVTSLADVRTDGWLEQFEERIGNFERVCEVMGKRFLAYSIILGVQIRSIVTDPRFSSNATIEFAVADNQPQTLALGEYKIKLVQALANNTHTPPAPTLPIEAEQASEIIGIRNILLAPLFDISLQRFAVASVDPDQPRALVSYISEKGYNLIDLKEFDDLIRQRVRRDLAGVAGDSFKLDLDAVERAKKAFAQGDLDGVISALETWPGLLSILYRTPVAQQLNSEQRTLIGEGLELLGTAFKDRGRDTWSQELYRLGLQFIREGLQAGRLFFRLGVQMFDENRYGEAIGMLRRAIKLGIPENHVMVALGSSLLRQNCVIAGAALLENAVARGISSEEIQKDLNEIKNILEKSGVSWDVPLVEPCLSDPLLLE